MKILEFVHFTQTFLKNNLDHLLVSGVEQFYLGVHEAGQNTLFHSNHNLQCFFRILYISARIQDLELTANSLSSFLDMIFLVRLSAVVLYFGSTAPNEKCTNLL